MAKMSFWNIVLSLCHLWSQMLFTDFHSISLCRVLLHQSSFLLLHDRIIYLITITIIHKNEFCYLTTRKVVWSAELIIYFQINDCPTVTYIFFLLNLKEKFNTEVLIKRFNSLGIMHIEFVAVIPFLAKFGQHLRVH